jgi:hypothetical protein
MLRYTRIKVILPSIRPYIKCLNLPHILPPDINLIYLAKMATAVLLPIVPDVQMPDILRIDISMEDAPNLKAHASSSLRPEAPTGPKRQFHPRQRRLRKPIGDRDVPPARREQHDSSTAAPSAHQDQSASNSGATNPSSLYPDYYNGPVSCSLLTK